MASNVLHLDAPTAATLSVVARDTPRDDTSCVPWTRSARTLRMAATQNVLRGNIRAELARRGLRQEDLARELGITQAAVSLKLRAERPITDAEVLTIADFLGVEPGDLFRTPSQAGARVKASA